MVLPDRWVASGTSRSTSHVWIYTEINLKAHWLGSPAHLLVEFIEIRFRIKLSKKWIASFRFEIAEETTRLELVHLSWNRSGVCRHLLASLVILVLDLKNFGISREQLKRRKSQRDALQGIAFGGQTDAIFDRRWRGRRFFRHNTSFDDCSFSNKFELSVVSASLTRVRCAEQQRPFRSLSTWAL